MPPDKRKAAPARERLSGSTTHMGAETTTTKVHRKRAKRTIPGQVPLVKSATVRPPGMGLKTALVLPDEECPRCGEWHNHRSPWPVPALVEKSARCGVKYELATHLPKVTRRGRRAA
jgi:hypothetical protein